MPLSEYEQRVLDEMEQSLSSQDPHLATNLTSAPRSATLRYVVAIVGTLVGIGLLVVAMASSVAIVGVLGFLVMLVSVAAALAWPRKPIPLGTTPSSAGRSPSSAKRRSFMQRFEDRWDKRRSGS